MQLQPSEAKIQADAFQFIWGTYPQTRGCIWHVPNGGMRDAITGNQMKAAGLVPGVQDLHMVWKGKHFYIEMKDHKGTVGIDQKFIHAQHKLHGMDTYVFRSAADLTKFIEAVIFGKDLEPFSTFISPYSDASKVKQYYAELREHNNKKAIARLKRRAA